MDRYSRVDLPPRHELRRVEDGQLICELEQADASELIEKGWRAPEVFTAKGRDGVTDIWASSVDQRISIQPRSTRSSKTFMRDRKARLFPRRSARRSAIERSMSWVSSWCKSMVWGPPIVRKAFHDVCWHNLKDGGFEDRIAWIKSAAAKHPEMDVERVGIYGVSAGGQNAAAAVLFHQMFYKAAVAGCGCHDNRMDKASWNEQWMGYPVGPHYAECSNIDNAHRLGGKLLLIVGELDDNVPPESTLRFADALIRLIRISNCWWCPTRGMGSVVRYGERRMRDFFVRHLNPTR